MLEQINNAESNPHERYITHIHPEQIHRRCLYNNAFFEFRVSYVCSRKTFYGGLAGSDFSKEFSINFVGNHNLILLLVTKQDGSNNVDKGTSLNYVFCFRRILKISLFIKGHLVQFMARWHESTWIYKIVWKLKLRPTERVGLKLRFWGVLKRILRYDYEIEFMWKLFWCVTWNQ